MQRARVFFRCRLSVLCGRVSPPKSPLPRLIPLLVFSTLLMVCCAQDPFPPVQLSPLTGPDPASVRAFFESAQPRSFRTLNSVVFRFRGKEISGLGMVEVDLAQEGFKLACMTPVGVTLFEITGHKEEVVCQFALEDLRRRGDLAKVVGADIRRAYFGNVPDPGAQVELQEKILVFRESQGRSHVEHRFGGTDLRLLEKRFFEGRRLVCRARYFEYQERDGKLLPGGIVLENRKYHYRLIVRLKQVSQLG